MIEIFKDAKTPQDTLRVEIREEVLDTLIEVSIYESGAAMVYLDKAEALRLAKTINDIFDS